MLCQTIGGILQLTTLDISQVENFIVHEQLGAKRKNYVRNTQGDYVYTTSLRAQNSYSYSSPLHLYTRIQVGIVMGKYSSAL